MREGNKRERERERDHDDDDYDNGTIIFQAMDKQQQQHSQQSLIVKAVASNGRNVYRSGCCWLVWRMRRDGTWYSGTHPPPFLGLIS